MTDAWTVADPTVCETCGKHDCEDHVPPEPNSPEASNPEEEHQRRVRLAVERERSLREARRQVDREERGSLTLPVFTTLRERLTRPEPATRWRIHGWQPRDARVMLAAQFKAGKTTLVGNYLRSLVDLDPFLARDTVEPLEGTAVLIDTEMSPSQLDGWLRAQSIVNDDRVVPVPLRGTVSSFNLLDPEVRSRWAERLRAYGARHLTLDCLRPVLDALGLDEHSQAGHFLVAFDALLLEAQIPEALIVHHMGHNGERSRGDSRIRDWPDVEWRLMRRDDNPSSPRFIAAYGRDVDQPEAELGYHSLFRHLEIGTGTRQDAAARDALTAVLAALVTAGEPLSGRSVKALLQDSGHSRDAVDGALRLGIRNGVLAKEPGARNAMLYQPVSGVSGSVRPSSPDTGE